MTTARGADDPGSRAGAAAESREAAAPGSRAGAVAESREAAALGSRDGATPKSRHGEPTRALGAAETSVGTVLAGTRPARGAIAIFVKTPGRSPVKTRLAAAIGPVAARAWHARAAAVVAEVALAAARASGAAAYFAVAEADALADAAWAALPCLPQGPGGLGARMGRVHDALVRRHGAGVLLGADAPQLAVGALVDTLAWCRAVEPRQVLGPARDGGFWLYAGNRTAPQATWEAVAYSRPDTAERFRAAFASFGAFRELAPLADVDHAEDLHAMRRELAALGEATPAQRALRAWLDAGGLGAAAEEAR